MEVAFLFESLVFLFLRSEGAHYLDGRESLLRNRRDHSEPLLYHGADAPQLRGRLVDDEDGDGDYREGRERKLPVEEEQQPDYSEEGDALHDEVDYDVPQNVLERRDVVRDAREELARALLVEREQREPLRVVVELEPYVDDDLLPDPRHEVEVRVGEYRLEYIEHDDADAEDVEHVELFLNQHVVDDVLDEPRRDDAEYRGEHHAAYRVGEPLLVGQAVLEQAHVGLPFLFLR